MRSEEEIERQFGFRGKSTIDAIGRVLKAVEETISWAVVILVDVKSAFNTMEQSDR